MIFDILVGSQPLQPKELPRNVGVEEMFRYFVKSYCVKEAIMKLRKNNMDKKSSG